VFPLVFFFCAWWGLFNLCVCGVMVGSRLHSVEQFVVGGFFWGVEFWWRLCELFRVFFWGVIWCGLLACGGMVDVQGKYG